MTLETAETIDVHAHAVLEATMGAAGAHGPTLSFDERPKFTVANTSLPASSIAAVRLWTLIFEFSQWIGQVSIFKSCRRIR